jgi:uncharacterized membrane protein YfcA
LFHTATSDNQFGPAQVRSNEGVDHEWRAFLLLSAAVFLGGFVSGFAGFAFSAVAGGILLHTLLPMEAVPLMMACSVGVQATNLWALRREIE